MKIEFIYVDYINKTNESVIYSYIVTIYYKNKKDGGILWYILDHPMNSALKTS